MGRPQVSGWSATRTDAPAPAAAEVLTSDWVRLRAAPPDGATSTPAVFERDRFGAACYSDQASAAGGLVLQFSNDEAASKDVHYAISATVPAGDGVILQEDVAFTFGRVQYTAGVVAPATFNLKLFQRDA